MSVLLIFVSIFCLIVFSFALGDLGNLPYDTDRREKEYQKNLRVAVVTGSIILFTIGLIVLEVSLIDKEYEWELQNTLITDQYNDGNITFDEPVEIKEYDYRDDRWWTVFGDKSRAEIRYLDD